MQSGRDAKFILVISQAKGGPVAREMPIHPVLMAALRKWHAQYGREGVRHTVHFRGRQIKPFGRAWRQAVARAKIGRRDWPYDLRHDFVSQGSPKGRE